MYKYKDKKYAKTRIDYGFLIPVGSTYKAAKEYAQTVLSDMHNLGYKQTGWRENDDKENCNIDFEESEGFSFGDLYLFRDRDGWCVSLSVYYK